MASAPELRGPESNVLEFEGTMVQEHRYRVRCVPVPAGDLPWEVVVKCVLEMSAQLHQVGHRSLAPTASRPWCVGGTERKTIPLPE